MGRFELAQRSANRGHSKCQLMAGMVLGFLQLILQSALVTSEEVRVATYFDAPARGYYRAAHELRYAMIGNDPIPEAIANVPVPLVTKEVAARLSTESIEATQLRLWHDGPVQFAAKFPASMNTGVLRYHAMRYNTSVQCEAVPKDRFPETCPGPNPFYGNLSLPSVDTDFDFDQNFLIRWCLPGNISSSPWLVSRDRQDIAEDFFLDFFRPNGTYSNETPESFTTHCSADTTRGYFELPNYHNNYTVGPLLESWTSPQEQSATTNEVPDDSYTGYLGDYFNWPYSSNYPYNNYEQLTPGPLATSMISMLGDESWILPLQNISETTDPSILKTIYRDMCTGRIPFLSWDDEKGFSIQRGSCKLDNRGRSGTLQDIKRQTYGWFNHFSETSMVNETLASAAFFANEATLTRAAARGYWRLAPGVIYTSAGATAHKPSISLPAQIVISVLIGIEALAILILLAFIYHTPTFTNRLDALIVATVGAQLSAAGIELPHLNETGETRHKLLKDHDGVIGFNYGGLTDEQIRDSSDRGATHVQAGASSDNDIELNNMDEPHPAKILIVGGIGSL
ncbi:hypothetical protein E0Z10_g388 [Xylaria hypoxylon]|uniref:Uncharacterized protein n=1 Tax=Xylaria hypoxylon TaxID=37992 RepID=A0A4Z0ZFH3_9PEZI|nr:hypothetical protein E0Z10_g388 [Xylaria hypoxylon]